MGKFLARKEPGTVFIGNLETPNYNCALLSSGSLVLKCLLLLHLLVFLNERNGVCLLHLEAHGHGS